MFVSPGDGPLRTVEDLELTTASWEQHIPGEPGLH